MRSTPRSVVVGALIAIVLSGSSAVRAQDEKKDGAAPDKATTLTLIGGGQYVNDVDARGTATKRIP